MKTSLLTALPLLMLSTAGCSAKVSTDPRGPSPAAVEDLSPFVVVEPPKAAPSPLPPGASSSIRHAYGHASIEVREDVARTVVTDVLVNDSDAVAKVTYRFPLPSDATIAGFADFRDGVRVEASVGGKDAARKAFDEAQAKGEQGALAETDGPMGFKMDLTPLGAHETRRVELTYVETLHAVGSERTFVYPAGYATDRPATLFELELRLTAKSAVTSIECPNQPEARCKQTAARMGRASIERLAAPLESDMVVRWTETAAPLELSARAVRARADEPGYVEAHFSFTRDPYADAVPPRDVVFVVDTSLSMSGDALARAKEVALQSLANLTARDRVALVTFDAAVRSWSALAPADDGARRRLEDELRALPASGASNLDAAIDRAHELLAKSEHPLIVLATDGQPTVGEDLDRLTPATPPDGFRETSVAVALFNYPSRQKALEPLFPRLTATYVPSGKAGEATVRQIARLASAPVIEGVELTIDGAERVQGHVPPALAMGENVRVVARANGPTTVRLKGTLHGKAVDMTQRIEMPAAVTDGDPLPVEWARMRIADLETAYRSTHDEQAKKEIVALGTSYHLVSSMTSLVATDDTVSPDRIMPGDPEVRVLAPRGATAVRAILPWGESVACAWDDYEGLWLGRFLVPRGIADGLYRVRVYVDFQERTSLRTTLLLRVDSAPPEFELALTRKDAGLWLEATPVRDVFDRTGDSLRKDLVDVKSVTVRVGDDTLSLEKGDDDRWRAELPAELARGTTLDAEIVATDFARNTSTRRSLLQVRP